MTGILVLSGLWAAGFMVSCSLDSIAEALRTVGYEMRISREERRDRK